MFGKLAKTKMMAGMTKKIMHRWSVCQNLSFSEQLKAGVRYFDLRIGFKHKASKVLETEEHHHKALRFVHGLYGSQVRTGLAEFQHFLEEHPREVVFLHFQHFYNFKEDTHKHCINLITKMFDRKLCPEPKHASDLTLKHMWEKNLQVIVLYKHSSVEQEGSLIWNTRQIENPWGNASSSGDLIKFLRNGTKGVERKDKKFHVSQAVVTPNQSMIMKHCTSSLKECCAKKAYKDIDKWLQSLSPNEHGRNIFMADFVEMGDFIQNVLRLNKA